MQAWLISRFQLFLFSILLFSAPSITWAAPQTIHVFVALADNKTQGIVPVPARIGNGDDPEKNLYWGCDEGLKSLFRRSPQWRLVESRPNPSPVILERCIFKHASLDAWLIADAYRGSQLRQAVADFLAATAGHHQEKLRIQKTASPTSSEKRIIELPIGGAASLAAWIGHDGLMDFIPPSGPDQTGQSQKPVIILCCKSEQFFSEPLRRAGARPILLTTQLMYPGSFILKSALEGWLRGESSEQIHDRAAHAYAANQKISLKAARGVFSTPKAIEKE